MSEAANDHTSGLNQCQQASTSAAEHQEAEPSCLNKALEDEKHIAATKLLSQGVDGNVTTVTSLTCSELEGKDKVEIPAVEVSRSSSQTNMGSPQNILPAAVAALGSSTSASNERKENSQRYLEEAHESKHKGCSDMATADVPTVMEEEEVALPPKKKQRVVSAPAERATEQCETEVQSQPIKGPQVSRKEADSAVLSSDESGVPCGPGFQGCADQECNPQGEAGACPAAVCPEQQQTSHLTEAVGLEFPDYVSDSQLNTITLIEDLMMERDHGSPACPDATDLMCGLTQELSSLNRKVMAAHRELENLHRSSKSSRSSLR